MLSACWFQRDFCVVQTNVSGEVASGAGAREGSRNVVLIHLVRVAGVEKILPCGTISCSAARAVAINNP